VTTKVVKKVEADTRRDDERHPSLRAWGREGGGEYGG